MAKKKMVRTQTLEVDLEALKIGLGGLEDVSEDLAEVQANLRKYLDGTEESLGFYPRKKAVSRDKPGSRAKTGRR
jgi:hypothetical protein